ncbi:hypothetical protein H8D57_03055 [bacterium]|nr:hypothetical protein [bacterium]
MFNRITISSCVLLLLACIAGCEIPQKYSKSVLEARSAFAEILDDFETQTKRVHQEVDEGCQSLLDFKQLIKEARDKDKEFGKVYTKWEHVEQEVVRLKKKFEDLVKSADKLFADLRDRANSIVDQTKKQKSLERIKDAEAKYIVRLKQAKNGMGKLDEVNTKVNDVMKELEVLYVIESIDEKIDVAFSEIDVLVKSVMTELNELLTESRSLLEKKIEE